MTKERPGRVGEWWSGEDARRGSGGGPAAAMHRGDGQGTRVGAGEMKRRGWIFRTDFRIEPTGVFDRFVAGRRVRNKRNEGLLYCLPCV